MVCLAMISFAITKAQVNNFDRVETLKKRISASREDTSKVRLLAELMQAHLYFSTAQGLTYRQQAIDLAENLHWIKGIALVKEAAGRLYWGMADGKSAVKDHLDALDLYRQLSDKKGVSRVSRYLGQDYMDNGIYPDAKIHLDEALKTAEEINDKPLQASAYDIFSAFYNAQTNSVEAAKASYAYLKIIEEIHDTASLGGAMESLGENLIASGNLAEGHKYLVKSLEIATQNNDNAEMQMGNMALGEFNLKTGNLPAAKAYFIKTRDLAEIAGDGRTVGYVHGLIGNVYKQMGKYHEALEQYLLAIEHSDQEIRSGRILEIYAHIGFVHTMLGKYKLAKAAFLEVGNPYNPPGTALLRKTYFEGLYKLDSATGNWKDAYKHYNLFVALKDSNFNKETLRTLVASQTQYEADKKEAILKTAQEKKDLVLQEETKRQRYIRNAAFTGLGLVLLFMLFVYKQRNRIAREKKRSDQLVQEKELLLREIHHRVKNNLEVVSSLLALQSAQIDDPNTKEAMLAGQNRVHSIGIVHQKLYEGTNLGAIEMKDYFINLSESILDSFGAEKRVTIECAMDQLDVDIDTAVPLGLIVNELLTNTLKYAFPEGQSGKVRIKLQKQTDGALHLEVSDDGVGKSGITQGTGFGGQLVALLTQQLGGSMREEVKDGTHIYFEFKTIKAA